MYTLYTPYIHLIYQQVPAGSVFECLIGMGVMVKYGWRAQVGITVVPCFVALLFLPLCDESARFYAISGTIFNNCLHCINRENFNLRYCVRCQFFNILSSLCINRSNQFSRASQLWGSGLNIDTHIPRSRKLGGKMTLWLHHITW